MPDDVPISGLPAAGPLTGTEVLPMLQDGETVRSTVSDVRAGVRSPFAPAAAIAETFDRSGTAISNATAVLTSGTLRVVAIPLTEGDVVTAINFISGSTNAGTSTHLWFSLWDTETAGGDLLGVTADDTAGNPWAANTLKSMALTDPYEVTATGLYYLGIVSVAAQVPTLQGITASHAVVAGLAPILTGNTSRTGLTTPGAAPADYGTVTASPARPYGYVS